MKDAAKLTDALQDVVNNANGLAAVQLDDVDIQEIQHHNQYQKPEDDDDKNAIPTGAFEEEFEIEGETTIVDNRTELELEHVAPPSMLPPALTSRRLSTAELEDTSTLIVHDRIHAVPDSKFKLALGLHANNTGMSRSEYTSLLEILKMLDHPEI